MEKCEHKNAWVIDTDIEPPSSTRYSNIFCPDCGGNWWERSKHCKYPDVKPKISTSNNN